MTKVVSPSRGAKTKKDVRDKHKLDYSEWTKEKKVVPRTLREIANEVGFPFAARAIIDLPAPSYTHVITTGSVISVIRDPTKEEIRKCGIKEDWIVATGATYPPIRADVPRWELLGDKT